MNYDLGQLGDRNFEHLTQSLAARFVGQAVGVFGDGGDGGREATWNGPLSSDTRLPNDWVGYGVLQAKYKVKDTTVPKVNADWLIKELNTELDGWAAEGSNRARTPDYLLIATNVTLSPGNGGGIEAVEAAVQKRIEALKLPIKGWLVWHYDVLRTLLDSASDIHATYFAWIAPGDIFARLAESLDQESVQLRDAISSYTAKSLIGDTSLNLTQAGSVGDGGAKVEDVFFDLPLVLESSLGFRGTAQALITMANRPRSADRSTQVHLAIVGGPGQGKSTVTQFICQLYRARFLAGQPAAAEADVADAVSRTVDRASFLELPEVEGRRWPIRVILTDFADSLASGASTSMFDFISGLLAKRSGYDVEPAQTRKWLKSYPWLLLLDGFDEVPSSSNRASVVQAVNDFLIDASNLSADVRVIVTTRPQGYNGEFAHKCHHLELAPLSPALALDYARRLVELRVGAGGDRFERISAQLERAAADVDTSRLMTTPLQVTILSLLVERQGQAPRDRWRLFSQYYKVIFQREQEKGGELAELLSDFESDIHAIHYSAGHELQARSERAGDTESVLTPEELNEMLVRRLESQGHGVEISEQLAQKFARLATERLVFLAVLKTDSIGFEIRSLQEFMAGEHLIESPPTKVVSALRSVALSDHWQNAVLFAVGKIFAERQSHRTDVLALCEILNSESRALEIARPGSLLALKILEEGIVRNQPTFGKALTTIAARSWGSGPTGFLDRFAHLGRGDDLDDLARSFDDAVSSGECTVLAGARLYAALVDAGHDASKNNLRILVLKADRETQADLVRLAWAIRSIPLLDAVKDITLDYAPALIESYRVGEVDYLTPQSGFERRVENSGLPTYIQGLLHLRGGDYESTYLAIREEPKVQLNLCFFGANESSWEAVGQVDSEEGGWQVISAMANFALNPSAELLAHCLSLASTAYSPVLRRLSYASPWPMQVCWRWVEWAYESSDPHRDVPALFTALADVARSGQLGDTASWHAAEDRWKTLDAVEAKKEMLATIPPILEPVGMRLPVWPGLATEGFLARTRGLRVSHSDVENSTTVGSWQADILQSVLSRDKSDHQSALAEIVLFDASVINRKEESGGRQLSLESLLVLVETAANQRVAHWIEALTVEQLETETLVPLLRQFGLEAQFQYVRPAAADALNRRWLADQPENWMIGRLAFLFGGVVDEREIEDLTDEPVKLASLHAATRLIGGKDVYGANELDRMWSALGKGRSVADGWSDAINAWSLLEHPEFLMDVGRADDPRTQNLADLIARSRGDAPLWSAAATAALIGCLSTIPANVADRGVQID